MFGNLGNLRLWHLACLGRGPREEPFGSGDATPPAAARPSPNLRTATPQREGPCDATVMKPSIYQSIIKSIRNPLYQKKGIEHEYWNHLNIWLEK